MPEIYKQNIALPKDFPFIMFEAGGVKVDVPNLHLHNCFEINYVKEGHGLYFISNKKYFIMPKDVYIINNIEPHYAWDAGNLKMLVILFDSSLLLTGEQDILGYEYLKSFNISNNGYYNRIEVEDEFSDKIIQIISSIENEFIKKDFGYKLLIRSLLFELSAYLYRLYSSKIKSIDTMDYANIERIKKAINFIKQNYNNQIHIEDIAGTCNMSPSYFCSVFKKTLGITPIEYLTKVRIQKAIELLSYTDMSITEIAFEVGFNSATNFNISFKKYTGTTPKSYRRKR